MPSATYRMHQKLSDGSYQAIHVESESGVILRPNGDTVEQTLRCCVLAEDAGDNVPGFVVDADTLGGSTKEEIIAAVPTYTHPTEKVCNYSVDTSSFATKSEIDELEKKIAIGTLGLSTPVLGARIRIGGFDYVIVHIDTSIVYAIIEVCPMETQFGSNSTYAGSTIANLCNTWYNTNVPAALRNAGVFVSVTTEGVSSPCFIPTYDQMNGGFSYFTDIAHRNAAAFVNAGFVSGSYNGYNYWTSTANSSGNAWYVNNTGDFSGNRGPSTSGGFRPCLAINRSVFS